MRFERRKIVLTGGSGALGSLVAAELLHGGAVLTTVGRRKPELIGANHLTADLGSMVDLAALTTQLSALAPDILINLAGAQHFGPVERQSAERVHDAYMVNLVAPVLLTQAVLPAMKGRGSGQIVNIGSIFGSINYPHFATYSSAKAGLRGFSEALRREIGSGGIAVTYVAPRAMKAGFASGSVRDFVKMARMKTDEPADVARVIVRAIADRRKEVLLGLPERLFVRLNAFAPRIVDAALAGQTAKVSRIFSN
jgi:short-subunit dehydrogenase